MTLDETEIARLDERARQIGVQIGYDLRFVVLPSGEHLALSLTHIDAGGEQVTLIVVGPKRLEDFAAYEIDLELDAIERGDRRVYFDEDGDAYVR